MKEALAPMFMDNPDNPDSSPAIVAVEQARELLLVALRGVSFGLLGDEESLTMLLALESVGRVVDGARALSTTDVLHRSEYFDAAAAAAAATNAGAESVKPGSVAPESAAPGAAGLGAPTLARRLGCRSGVDLVCALARLSRTERCASAPRSAKKPATGCSSAGPSLPPTPSLVKHSGAGHSVWSRPE